MYLDWTFRNSEDTENAVEYFTGHSIQGTIISCCIIVTWETSSSERLKKKDYRDTFFLKSYFHLLVLEMNKSICLLSIFHW